MNGTTQPDGSKPHEWERLDNGEAYCTHCPAKNGWGVKECMSGDAKTIIKTGEPRMVSAEHKPARDGSIPHGSKDQEIENLKRLLASVSQRLDSLKTR